jgi:hypothetical protein
VEATDRKTWSGRFSLLTPWFSDIIDAVKRDCKNEHLRLNPHFVKEYFAGLPMHMINLEEMRVVYLRLILAGNEQVAEFISNRWLFRHMELYNFFEKALSEVSTEFEKIQELPADKSLAIIQTACEQFGCEKVFCFVVINDVVIPQNVFDRLQRQAVESLAMRQKEQEGSLSVEEKWRQDVEKLKERQEKKIQEMTKRHQIEVQKLSAEIVKLREQISSSKQTKCSCV